MYRLQQQVIACVLPHCVMISGMTPLFVCCSPLYFAILMFLYFLKVMAQWRNGYSVGLAISKLWVEI